MDDEYKKTFREFNAASIKLGVSILLVGVAAYFLPNSLLQNQLISDLSNFFVGAERWSKGSLFPDQIKVVWIYIIATLPLSTIWLMSKLDYTIENNKRIPFFKKDPVLIFLSAVGLFMAAIFLVKITIFCEFFNGFIPFENGPFENATFTASLYGDSYIGSLLISTGFGYVSASITSFVFFTLYHIFLRIFKKDNISLKDK
jgi:hypothetical protein